MSAPLPGTFVRPVGVHGYCLEIVRVVPRDDEGPEQWHCRRWGMDANRQPINDGQSGMQSGMCYMILPEAATHWMPMPEAPNA